LHSRQRRVHPSSSTNTSGTGHKPELATCTVDEGRVLPGSAFKDVSELAGLVQPADLVSAADERAPDQELWKRVSAAPGVEDSLQLTLECDIHGDVAFIHGDMEAPLRGALLGSATAEAGQIRSRPGRARRRGRPPRGSQATRRGALESRRGRSRGAPPVSSVAVGDRDAEAVVREPGLARATAARSRGSSSTVEGMKCESGRAEQSGGEGIREREERRERDWVEISRPWQRCDG
jgi:hypothetical protein